MGIPEQYMGIYPSYVRRRSENYGPFGNKVASIGYNPFYFMGSIRLKNLGMVP